MGYRFKPGTLAVRWKPNPDGLGPDLVAYYPRSSDGGMILHWFNRVVVYEGRTLLEELEARGYDPSTLQFTIRRKKSSE